MSKFGYVYLTTDNVNEKLYVGKHSSPIFDPRYKGTGKNISKAIKEFGFENFTVEVLAWVDSHEDLKRTEKKLIEEHWIKFGRDKMYNISRGGGSGLRSQEFKEKSRLRQIGEKSYWFGKKRSPETLAKMKASGFISGLGEKNHFFGKHHTEQTKALIRSKRKGQSAWNKGIPMTEETKIRLSKSTKGISKPFSESHRENHKNATRIANQAKALRNRQLKEMILVERGMHALSA